MAGLHDKPIISSKIRQTKDKALPAEKPPSQRGLFVFVVLALAAIVIVPYLVLRPRKEIYVLRAFQAASVAKSSISESISASGKLVPEENLVMKSLVAGKVLRLLVKPGDSVQKGQLLMQLESTDLQAAVVSAQDALQVALDSLSLEELRNRQDNQNRQEEIVGFQDALKVAARELKLNQDLFAIGAVAKMDLMKTQDAVSTASQALARANRGLKQLNLESGLKRRGLTRAITEAQNSLSKAKTAVLSQKVVAPFAGQILEVGSQEGDFVLTDAPLFTLADTSRLRVDGELDESSASSVKPGQDVQVLIGEKTFAARVDKIAPQATTANNASNVPVTIVFKGISPKERPNTSVSFDITTAIHANVPSLPRGPFLTTGGERWVFVLISPNAAERRDVRFGVTNAERVEVLEGLEVGERIITSSYEAFKDQLSIQVSATGEQK